MPQAAPSSPVPTTSDITKKARPSNQRQQNLLLRPRSHLSTYLRHTINTVIMSWLGVAPFKKFNAPFCMSIRAARGRPPLEAHHVASPPAALHCGPTIANTLNSQAHVAFLRCRYVIATPPSGNRPRVRRNRTSDVRSRRRHCTRTTRLTVRTCRYCYRLRCQLCPERHERLYVSLLYLSPRCRTSTPADAMPRRRC